MPANIGRIGSIPRNGGRTAIRCVQESLLQKRGYCARQVQTLIFPSGTMNCEFGIYQAACCAWEIVLFSGAHFPQCPAHKKPTKWKLISTIGAPRPEKSEPAA